MHSHRKKKNDEIVPQYQIMPEEEGMTSIFSKI